MTIGNAGTRWCFSVRPSLAGEATRKIWDLVSRNFRAGNQIKLDWHSTHEATVLLRLSPPEYCSLYRTNNDSLKINIEHVDGFTFFSHRLFNLKGNQLCRWKMSETRESNASLWSSGIKDFDSVRIWRCLFFKMHGWWCEWKRCSATFSRRKEKRRVEYLVREGYRNTHSYRLDAFNCLALDGSSFNLQISSFYVVPLWRDLARAK